MESGHRASQDIGAGWRQSPAIMTIANMFPGLQASVFIESRGMEGIILDMQKRVQVVEA